MFKTEKSKKNIFGIILLILVFILIAMIDVFIGIMYDKIAPDFGRKNLSLALKSSAGEQPTLSQRSHPYLTYENTPHFYRYGIRQHNNMGYRNKDDTTILTTPSTIRVLILGGSTTYGQGVENPEDAWPSQMQDMVNQSLTKSSGYNVEVINGGLPWATSAELLNHYIFRDRYLKPDIVIIHTGGNDGGPLKFEDYTPEYTHWRTIRSGGGNALRPSEASIIKVSNIVKFIYAIWYNRMGYAAPIAYVHTESSANLERNEALRNVKNNEPTGFSRNLALLLSIIKQDGAIPLYFQFYRPGQEIFSEKGRAALEMAIKNTNFAELFDANQLASRKNETVAKAICKSQNIEYLQIDGGSIPIDYFVDQSHLDQHGQEFKAKFLTKRILPYITKLIEK